MHIAITLADNKGLESSVSPIFGRCPFYMLINPESKEFKIEENTAQSASGGAGVKASQWMIDKEVAAVISGNLGPKAHDVLSSANIPTAAQAPTASQSRKSPFANTLERAPAFKVCLPFINL